MATTASSSVNTFDWKILWDCLIPPKITIFAWQFCHNALATGTNLTKRQIRQINICPRYYHMVEDDLHLFVLCPFARSLWRETDFNVPVLMHKATSWLHLLHLLVDDSDRKKERLCCFIVCLWGFWIARNKWVFSGQLENPKTIVESSLAFLSSFQHSRVVIPLDANRPLEHPSKWLPPDIGWFILNTGASFQSTGASYAYIVRNHHGQVLQ